MKLAVGGDHADSHHWLTLPTVNRLAVHDVPQELGRKRIATDQEVAHLPNVESRSTGHCGS